MTVTTKGADELVCSRGKGARHAITIQIKAHSNDHTDMRRLWFTCEVVGAQPRIQDWVCVGLSFWMVGGKL